MNAEIGEQFHGLSVDLTNCLAQRNRELEEAKKAIGALIVAVIIGEADKHKAVTRGRDWLKTYNDRRYPRHTAAQQQSSMQVQGRNED